MTTSQWMVVLEVVKRRDASPVDTEVLQRVLEQLCEADPHSCQPLALLADDRYSLHLSVTASHLSEALMIAVLRWENVSKRLGVDGWDARRAEVMTKADFEAEAQHLTRYARRTGEG
jgi:hypothetical protein